MLVNGGYVLIYVEIQCDAKNGIKTKNRNGFLTSEKSYLPTAARHPSS